MTKGVKLTNSVRKMAIFSSLFYLFFCDVIFEFDHNLETRSRCGIKSFFNLSNSDADN